MNQPTQVNKVDAPIGSFKIQMQSLGEMNKKGISKAKATYPLAKKFLPENCAFRLGNLIHANILTVINELLLEEVKIDDLRIICRKCEHIKCCVVYKN